MRWQALINPLFMDAPRCLGRVKIPGAAPLEISLKLRHTDARVSRSASFFKLVHHLALVLADIGILRNPLLAREFSKHCVNAVVEWVVVALYLHFVMVDDADNRKAFAVFTPSIEVLPNAGDYFVPPFF